MVWVSFFSPSLFVCSLFDFVLHLKLSSFVCLHSMCRYTHARREGNKRVRFDLIVFIKLEIPHLQFFLFRQTNNVGFSQETFTRQIFFVCFCKETDLFGCYLSFIQNSLQSVYYQAPNQVFIVRTLEYYIFTKQDLDKHEKNKEILFPLDFFFFQTICGLTPREM